MNKNTQKLLKLNDINISNNSSFILIAGPCAVESKDHALEIASNINSICKELNIKFIYKSSFDKANRSSINSMRGVGLNEALKIFEYLNDISYYELIVCGHGPETKNFQTKFYKSKYSSNIKFYGYVENKKLFKLIQLSRFSFGLWKDDKDDNSQFADPGKVKLSILLGTPCILSNHLYSFEIFKDECGPVIFNGSLDTFNFPQSFFNEKIYKNYLNNCEKYINECLLNYHLDPFAKPSN